MAGFRYYSVFTFGMLVLIFASPGLGWALTPEQVVVIANKMAWHSVELAKYYMKKRDIPSNNLIKINAPAVEYCSRDDYERYIASPIKAFLNKNDPEGNKFHCLVTMYGIPLRVNSPELTSEEKKQLSELRKQHDSIRKQIDKMEQEKDNKELKALREEEAQIKRKIDQVGKVFQGVPLTRNWLWSEKTIIHWMAGFPINIFWDTVGKRSKTYLKRSFW